MWRCFQLCPRRLRIGPTSRGKFAKVRKVQTASPDSNSEFFLCFRMLPSSSVIHPDSSLIQYDITSHFSTCRAHGTHYSSAICFLAGRLNSFALIYIRGVGYSIGDHSLRHRVQSRYRCQQFSSTSKEILYNVAWVVDLQLHSIHRHVAIYKLEAQKPIAGDDRPEQPTNWNTSQARDNRSVFAPCA